MNQLLSPKELAEALRRSDRYVRHMKSRGFKMPGGYATFEDARNWLEKNPAPCRISSKKS